MTPRPSTPRLPPILLLAALLTAPVLASPAAAQVPETAVSPPDALPVNATQPASDPSPPSLSTVAAFASPIRPGSPTLFSDNFDDNSLDSSKWTVVDQGWSVAETNQRLEMTVREQAETAATVRSAAISKTFGAAEGVDANVKQARHVAGEGFVDRVRFRVERSDDADKWVEIKYDPWGYTINLEDSAGNSYSLGAGRPIGYHDLRLVVTGSYYTGHYDTVSFQRSSTLFSGATGVTIAFVDTTGGSSGGITETAARDDAIVYGFAPVPPSAPTGVATACASNGVQLSWSAPSDNGDSPVTSYTVYHGATNPPTETTSRATASWNHVPPWSTSLYHYQVAAVNGVGEGPKSSPVVSRAPCDLVAPTVSGNPVTLPWSNVAPTLSGVTWRDDYSGLGSSSSWVGTCSGCSNVAGSAGMPAPPAGSLGPWSPSWTPAVSYAQGTNYVTTAIHDRYGSTLQTNGAYVVRFDSVSPTASTSPSGQALPILLPWTKGPTASLPGSVCFNDPTSQVATTGHQYWIGTAPGASDLLAPTGMTGPATAQPSWCPSFSISTSALAQGSGNYVTMAVRDAAGNVATVTAYRVQYDNAGDNVPTLTAAQTCGGTIIPENAWQNDNTPCYSWSIPSSSSPIAGYSHSLSTVGSATPDTTVDTTGTTHSATLADGTWHFKVRAVDQAANWGGVKGPATLKIDATLPTIPSVSSSTHPSQTAFHKSTTLFVSWSASDALSGVDGYRHVLQTSACPSSIPGGAWMEETTTSASFPGLAPFGTHRFCIQAKDNAGNWGPVATYVANVDAVPPTVDSTSPGGVTTNPLARVTASYSDADGGADPAPRRTVVDAATVKLYVDGVDVIQTWGGVCAPRGPLVACRVDVSGDGIDYQPILPWQDGPHNVFLSLADTAAGGGNAVVASWSFTVNTGGSTDEDNDRVPDAMEPVICSREQVAMLVNALGAGRCPTAFPFDDYEPPQNEATLFVPTGVVLGPDADGDGAPATVTLQGVNVNVKPFRLDSVHVLPADDVEQTIDADDSNPNVPAQSVIVAPEPVPVGYAFGPDADEDGVPRTLTLERATVTFDRRNPLNPVTLGAAPPAPIALDANDADPNVPAQSVFTLPVPAPIGASPGPDADRDGVPATVTVQRATVTFDRRDALDPVTLGPAPSLSQTLDGDDADPNVPAQSVVQAPAPIPAGARLGPDADRDGVPASLVIDQVIVTVDRRNPADPVTLQGAPSVTRTLDDNDADPNVPAPSVFTVSVPYVPALGPDNDRDLVPSTVILNWLDVRVDRRTGSPTPVTIGSRSTAQTLDPDDSDRGDPAPFPLVDPDGDFVPDAAEPFLCGFQDRTTPADGRCVRDDGTGNDGDGDNYVPPGLPAGP